MRGRLPRFADMSCVLQPVQTFVQLNVSSPGVGQECQGNTQIGPLGERHIELHSVGFSLLAKRLEVFDLESDMVQPPSFGRHGRGVRFCNEKCHSGHVGAANWPRLKGAAPNILAYHDCISITEDSATQKCIWSNAIGTVSEVFSSISILTRSSGVVTYA